MEQRELFFDNLLFRIHFIVETIWWTGLAPWKIEFNFPGSIIYQSVGHPLPSEDGATQNVVRTST